MKVRRNCSGSSENLRKNNIRKKQLLGVKKMAAAKVITVNAALASDLSELNSVFAIKINKKTALTLTHY